MLLKHGGLLRGVHLDLGLAGVQLYILFCRAIEVISNADGQFCRMMDLLLIWCLSVENLSHFPALMQNW